LESARCAIDHAVTEAYSVLTRVPEPGRLAPGLAAEAIADIIDSVISLPESSRLRLPSALAKLGISGGATYDGLIALTASHHGATLLTLDSRAARTYTACGVDFNLLTV
jgi:predicted nucleic acid-binding protein